MVFQGFFSLLWQEVKYVGKKGLFEVELVKATQ
jgi:hypothetical protein